MVPGLNGELVPMPSSTCAAPKLKGSMASWPDLPRPLRLEAQTAEICIARGQLNSVDDVRVYVCVSELTCGVPVPVPPPANNNEKKQAVGRC
ncbi:hypothetical protein NDU88_000975 [Pleurodeles waltl]|uniref:Uncharacterized protein n=1 Tax=Pleurodeles waltl TaxID=8319 RepID=A0AAV7VZQ9_PLEWA|nr:hypothetical protein NDU88_000975 [Pleurodeles waltl]